MDADDYTSAEELMALARDRKGWAARVRQVDPVDHNTAASMVTSLLGKCRRVEKGCRDT